MWNVDTTLYMYTPLELYSNQNKLFALIKNPREKSFLKICYMYFGIIKYQIKYIPSKA